MFNLIRKQPQPDTRVLNQFDKLVEPLVDCTEENILELLAPLPHETLTAEEWRERFGAPCQDYFPHPATWNMHFDYNHEDGGLVLENVRVLTTLWEEEAYSGDKHPEAHIITSNGKLVNRIYGSMELDDLCVR